MIVSIVVAAAVLIFVSTFVYERIRRRNLRRLAESSGNAVRSTNPTGAPERPLASEVLLRSDGNP